MHGDVSAGIAPGTPSDDELLAGARRGDAAALEALLVRYQPRLFRFGLRMCGNEDEAGDVAQESLIAMARAVPQFRGDASLATWLYTIARRVCIRQRRRSRFAPQRPESLDGPGVDAAHRVADPAPNPERAAESREIEAALAAAIAGLEDGQREVLVLRDVEGLPAAEVARVLGIRVVAVKSRLHRARVAVRNRLAPLLGGPAADTPRLPGCPDVMPLFSRYLEGDIDSAVCARMAAHVAQCDRCRGACDTLKRSLAVCRQFPEAPLPASLATAVKAAVRAFLAGQTGGGRGRRPGSQAAI
ncbi:MAG TPA: sigma-70 family RNA polymerase sigma factor [Vicinamibacterales bacterium]|nr:sigma-70 family RNA polymerase sigma factor [Vicinamibacterales bacterium]